MIPVKDIIEKYLCILNKNGELVKLEMNSAQLKVYEIIKNDFDNGRPMRYIVLKARQMGISTLIEAIIFCFTTFQFNKNSLIVAHTSESSNKIFNMFKRYYDHLPEAIQPMKKYSNRKEIVYSNPSKDNKEKRDNPGLGSSISVSTAGSGGVGRGSTYQYIHLSELAFWENDKDSALLGIMQTLPTLANTFLAIESTANGFDYFKTLWDDAYAGNSGFTAIFLPWYEMEEYTMPYDGFTASEEEIKLQNMYDLTLEQLAWRRYAISTLCGGDVDTFKQEYPSCPEEAFINTGRPVFNVENITQYLQVVEKPISTANFEYKYISQMISDIKLVEEYERRCGTIIYEYPKSGYPYVIGVDTAGEGADNNIAIVTNNHTNKIVAKLKVSTDADLFVKQLYCLGMFYNEAFVSIEINFSQYPVMEMQRLGYKNMYVRESFDTYTNSYKKAFGFRTTSTSKPVIIDNLKELVRENIEGCNDEDLLREMLVFVKHSNGKVGALEGYHDDHVMAFAINQFCRSEYRTNILVEIEKDEIEESSFDTDDFLRF